MFLALRDLRHAKGRFALIATVVALMTLLVGFLTGLTGGLAMQNISALLKLDSDRVVFSVPDGDNITFAGSSVTEDDMNSWRDVLEADKADATGTVTPLGISNVLLEGDGKSESVVVLAAPTGAATDAPESGIVLGESTAEELGVSGGDTLSMAGTDLEIRRVIDDQFYAHQSVAWTNLETWHDFRAATHQPEIYANVLLVQEPQGFDPAAVHSDTDTVSKSGYSALLALGSFKSEVGSLGMMIGMLVLIATLVIGVFFLVWSMQRQRDIAVLKAVGATTKWLAADAMAQAVLVLAIGAGVGIAITLGLGLLIRDSIPFEVNAVSIAGPALAMIAAGILGALVSLTQITATDPTAALQATTA